MTDADSANIPFLDEEAVRRLLDMDELIGAMERALIDYSAGRFTQPDRQLLEVAPYGGFFAAMPAVGKAVGVKLVSFYPGNADLGKPTHLALILLFRPETGEPLAMMDGRLITEMRTSAVSAAVARKVAAEDARVLAILGAGVQARTHFDALTRVRRFDDVRIWARSDEKARLLADEIGARAMGVEEAVRDADVVVTATSAKEPILQGAWLKPGALVTAVGWNTNRGRELDDAAMQNLVIVESRQGTANESGNIRGSGAEIFAEAGEVLAGEKSIDPGTTVIFDSV
ncbi:MAG: ornithine cyclodeaminase family protein, partial [Alphaproteobacteria bacterium]|nr:ornithine cyclodeaminase family protein [Alphaproteobacteria bacterium]